MSDGEEGGKERKVWGEAEEVEVGEVWWEAEEAEAGEVRRAEVMVGQMWEKGKGRYWEWAKG